MMTPVSKAAFCKAVNAGALARCDVEWRSERTWNITAWVRDGVELARKKRTLVGDFYYLNGGNA